MGVLVESLVMTTSLWCILLALNTSEILYTTIKLLYIASICLYRIKQLFSGRQVHMTNNIKYVNKSSNVAEKFTRQLTGRVASY